MERGRALICLALAGLSGAGCSGRKSAAVRDVDLNVAAQAAENDIANYAALRPRRGHASSRR